MHLRPVHGMWHPWPHRAHCLPAQPAAQKQGTPFQGKPVAPGKGRPQAAPPRKPGLQSLAAHGGGDTDFSSAEVVLDAVKGEQHFAQHDEGARQADPLESNVFEQVGGFGGARQAGEGQFLDKPLDALADDFCLANAKFSPAAAECFYFPANADRVAQSRHGEQNSHVAPLLAGHPFGQSPVEND